MVFFSFWELLIGQEGDILADSHLQRTHKDVSKIEYDAKHEDDPENKDNPRNIGPTNREKLAKVPPPKESLLRGKLACIPPSEKTTRGKLAHTQQPEES